MQTLDERHLANGVTAMRKIIIEHDTLFGSVWQRGSDPWKQGLREILTCTNGKHALNIWTTPCGRLLWGVVENGHTFSARLEMMQGRLAPGIPSVQSFLSEVL